MVFLRNPQIRYTPISGETSFAVGHENPSTDVDTGRLGEVDPAYADKHSGDSKYPDVSAQFRKEGGWGHVQVAGLYRRLGYDSTISTGPKGHNTGWGVDLTSTIKVRAKDKLLLGVVYGEGIANYMNDGGMDLAPKNNVGKIESEAVPLVGISAFRSHLERKVHQFHRLQPNPGGKHELPNGQHVPLRAIRLGKPALLSGQERLLRSGISVGYPQRQGRRLGLRSTDSALGELQVQLERL